MAQELFRFFYVPSEPLDHDHKATCPQWQPFNLQAVLYTVNAEWQFHAFLFFKKHVQSVVQFAKP